MTTPPTEAQLLGGGAQAAKFAAPGDSIDGTVMSKQIKQVTKMGTNEPEFFPSGDPKWQILATLQTTLRDDADDDGLRTVYIKSHMMGAVRSAVGQTGASELEPGGWLRVTFTNYGEAQRGLNPPKLFVAEYRRPDAQVLGVQPQSQTYQPPVQQQAAPVGYQPPPQPAPQPTQAYTYQGATPQTQQPDAATLAALEKSGLSPEAIQAVLASLAAKQG
jgi:hypothetical protein